MPKAIEILLYVLIPISFGLLVEEITHRLGRKAGKKKKEEADA